MIKLILAFILVLFSSTCYADITSGLVGWWKFDEASSGTCAGASVMDASGSGNTGTCVNSSTYGTGKIGPGAMSFDGSTQYVDMGDMNATESIGVLTVSTWFYSNPSQSYRTVVSKGYYSSGSWEMRMTRDIEGPTIDCCVVTTNGLHCVAIGVSNSQWNHVVMVYNGATVSVFKNGVFVSSTPQTGNIVNTAVSVMIGQNGNSGEYFNGQIDDVRIYNRALTDTEVAELYQYNLARIGNAHIVNARLGH